MNLLKRIDVWGKRVTGIWWLSIVGLLEHQLIGTATWLLLRSLSIVLHTPMVHPVIFVVICLIFGYVHERTQAQMGGSDFDPAAGGPYNGWLDVVAFVPLWPWWLL